MGEKAKAVEGYVLAGGGSTRFGRDKALAEIEGQPMLLRICQIVGSVTDEVILIVAASGKHESFGTKAIADRWPGEGPLGGIITALTNSGDMKDGPEWNMIVGCDMPFLSREWLNYLVKRAGASRAGVIVPRSTSGLEPLCACWRTSAAQKLQQAFDDGVRKVTEAMKRLQMEIVDESDWKRFDSAGRLFRNMNTAADYEEAKRIVETERA